MTVTITARCVACKATREVGEAESRRLSSTRNVPICERCGCPMVAESAEVELDDDGAAA